MNASIKRPRSFGTALRLVLATAILAVLAQQVGLRKIAAQLAEANHQWTMVAILLWIAVNLIKTWCWRYLVQAVEPAVTRPSFVRAGCCYMAGGFIGTIVPSTLGTDAIRTVLAAQAFGGQISRYAASTVTMNLFAFAGGALLGLVAAVRLLIVYPQIYLLKVAIAVFLAIVIGLFTTYMLLHKRRGLLLSMLRMTPRWGYRFRRPLRRFIDALLVFEKAHVSVWPVIGAAVLAQVLIVGVFAAVGAAIDVQVDWAVWMVVVPLISLGGLIPASISGFGADQAILIYLLAPFGVASSNSFAASALASLIVLLVHCTVGAFAFAVGRGFVPGVIGAR